MKTGRPKEPIILSEEEHEQLNAIANSRALPYSLVNRARIVLLTAQGIPNCTIAERVDLSPQMVCKWRQRYLHKDCRVSMTNYVQVSPDRFQMKKSPCLSIKPFKLNRKMEPIGQSGRWPRIPSYRAPPCIGFGKLLDFSLIVSAILSSPQTPSLLRKLGISWDCT